jgi:hypothetical protein
LGFTPDGQGFTPNGQGFTPDGQGFTPNGQGFTPDVLSINRLICDFGGFVGIMDAVISQPL